MNYSLGVLCLDIPFSYWAQADRNEGIHLLEGPSKHVDWWQVITKIFEIFYFIATL